MYATAPKCLYAQTNYNVSNALILTNSALTAYANSFRQLSVAALGDDNVAVPMIVGGHPAWNVTQTP